MKNEKCKIGEGFTLVELTVSLAITAIIMVGLSVFFANSFHNVFQTQEQLTQTQGQFVVNEIIRDKFRYLDEVVEPIMPHESDYVIIKNIITKDQMPFTYISENDGKLVFEDFFEFKGQIDGTSSDLFTPIKNPAGITEIAGIHYIAAPLENKIYECMNESTCLDLGILILNQPIDITTNDVQDKLYVTDSGNNRIIEISDIGDNNNINTLIDGLNFPVGIVYYNDGTNEYLFFSEPYKNKVYRVDIDGNNLKVVVGDGDNEACDNSAIYCKLNFPTGLIIDNNELYIADTGNDRILKITDPEEDLSSYKVSFDLEDDTQISQINFSFPTADDPLSIIINTDTYEYGNNLHKGRYNQAGNTYAYLLSTPILNGDATKPDCPEPPGPCTYTFERFTVSTDNNLFVTLDSIQLDGNPYTVTGTPTPMVDYYEVYVITDTDEISYPAGTIAKLTNDFATNPPPPAPPDSPYEFDFNLIGSIFDKAFNSVNVEIFDGNKELSQKVAQVIRIGDDTLGTLEDLIEIYDDTDLDYPTGLSMNGGLQINTGVDFDDDDVDFDYISDFEITDLTFSIFNGGEILQTAITTEIQTITEPKEQTYTITANVSS